VTSTPVAVAVIAEALSGAIKLRAKSKELRAKMMINFEAPCFTMLLPKMYEIIVAVIVIIASVGNSRPRCSFKTGSIAASSDNQNSVVFRPDFILSMFYLLLVI
jgi:hypothetical protein